DATNRASALGPSPESVERRALLGPVGRAGSRRTHRRKPLPLPKTVFSQVFGAGAKTHFQNPKAPPGWGVVRRSGLQCNSGPSPPACLAQTMCLRPGGDACVLGVVERAGNALYLAWGVQSARLVWRRHAPSTKLLCDALHRASPDPEGLGYPQHTHALCKLPSHLACGRVVYLRPTEFYTLGDGALEACFDPLPDHRPLELSKRAGYLEDELPHRGRRIDGLLVQIQVNPAGFQVLDRVEQVAQRATQAVNRPSHDDIESPTAGVFEHSVESRASVSPLGA